MGGREMRVITLYEQRFEKVHQLLMDHRCKSTFSFHKEYESPSPHAGAFFYRPEKEMNSDPVLKEWREVVDARLDVCVPTKKSFSEKDKIRFDIEWSQKAHLYSMYVSLPTSARSISLSHRRYKTEEKLMVDVENWLVKAGCKDQGKMTPKKTGSKKIEQLALF